MIVKDRRIAELEKELEELQKVRSGGKLVPFKKKSGTSPPPREPSVS